MYELEVQFREFAAYSKSERRYIHGCFENPQDLCKIISSLTLLGCEVLSVESRRCEYTKAQEMERSLVLFTLANNLHGGTLFGRYSVTNASVTEVICGMIKRG